MPLFHKSPIWAKMLFPRRIWNGPEEAIYLTFDDGPVPGATDFVLNELHKRGMKATFFVVGDNVRKNPSLAKEILEAGHAIGNHTYHHLFGLRTMTQEYLEDIAQCDRILKDRFDYSTSLFRPPYGWLKFSQARMISQNYQIIMWDVLSGDYSPDLSPQRILQVCQNHSSPNSIFLFHDQEKTIDLLPKFLPDFLDYILDQGYSTASL